jgi:cellulose synthase/poly-beta-1,6-N-acetylglucosamine synthase-like glycosyltransferase
MKTLVKLALLALLSPVAAYAQAGGSLEGKITEAHGRKLAGATVTARNKANGKEYKTTAGADGAFSFARLAPGSYIVRAQARGFEPMLAEAIVTPARPSKVGLAALAVAHTGNEAVDEFIASSKARGGPLPAGNISHLNVNDGWDLFFLYSYFGILGLLSAYGIYRYRLVYLFLRYRNHRPRPASRFDRARLPRVTVQLPLFNEMYVAERLIEAVVGLDYPRELLEIQVLDDSTDETRLVAARAVKKYFDLGHDITYHHRSERAGFKAGALEAGLKKSGGELILVFDADFVPRRDCILRMVDYFTDGGVGMVQMRWSHINRDYSLLTRVQAIMLDAHFVVEQTARNRAGGFFNFNGTAGMWRREAIEWSGGWQHDTLAEDTDLSYRAQLMGWRFVYLVDDDVPAELPVEMNAFKSQQRRWAKGLMQVGMKLMGRILRDPRLPMRVKLEQFFRLTGNLMAPLVIVLAVINLPVLIVRFNQQALNNLFLIDVPILTFSTLSILVFYTVTQWHLYPKTWRRSLKYMPFVLSTGIALSFSNARAAVEAVLGIKSPFVRTPKYKIEGRSDADWAQKSYAWRRVSVPWLELAFALYFAFTVWYAVQTDVAMTLPFLLIYLCGYAYAAVMSLFQGRVSLRRAGDKHE